MATFTPMPSASERMPAAAKPHARCRLRAAYRKFSISIVSSSSYQYWRSNRAIAGPTAIVLKIVRSTYAGGRISGRLWDVEVRYRH